MEAIKKCANPNCAGFKPLIAVHAGAGTFSHDRRREREQRQCVGSAAAAGLSVLAADGGSVECAVAAAVESMERSGVANAGAVPALRLLAFAADAVRHANAGFGSNLTSDARVECDASLMHGTRGSFVGVGAVSGIASPIGAALTLLSASASAPGFAPPLGRVSPLLLVGNGARDAAVVRDPSLAVHPDAQICDRAINQWTRIAEMVKDLASQQTSSTASDIRNTGDSDETPDLHELDHDTVGAVALDCCGNIASAVSSGGVLFKYPGRVGEAAMFACGVWAQSLSSSGDHHHACRVRNADSDSSQFSVRVGVGCSLSGTGEQIMRTQLALEVAKALLQTSSQSHPQEARNASLVQSPQHCTSDTLNVESALSFVLTNSFLDSSLLQIYDDGPKNAGVVCIRVSVAETGDDCDTDSDNDILSNPTETTPSTCKITSRREVWYAHTTDAMCVGWMSAGDAQPTTRLSRKTASRQAPMQGPSRSMSPSKKRKRWWAHTAPGSTPSGSAVSDSGPRVRVVGEQLC
ncbi:nucleophile aminohydrolase [Chytriomyces sp. MP71]|nr:nucleophile aminohydrolase [Chytriomyces sp. MP71]